jgi:D-glycero-D-manno-heptose 1,7-bisphosphate phosphatase
MINKKALFLDRDGIINIDHGYVSKIENFEFSEGIFELLHLFIKKGYLLFIVTNQSGIGRGYYTLKDFQTLTAWMLKHFEEEKIVIQEVVYCPHAPEENCQCRKPQTGMVDKILNQQPIDLTHSWLIGDKQSDIDLAINSSIATSIAIGDKVCQNSTYQFNTILECKTYIENHQELL